MPDKTWVQSDGMSRRAQEVAPGEYADEVYARDAWSAGIGMGGAWILGSGRMTLTVAGNLRGVLLNPTGSGKNVSVIAMTAFATATGWATLIENPTTGLPATAAAVGMPLRPSSPVRVTEMRVDTNATTALGGGTDTGVVIGVPGGSRTELKPIGKILVPGQSLGINIPFAGAADSAFAVYVVEE